MAAQPHHDSTCPGCQTPITAADETVVCPTCGMPSHKQCWEEHGGCTRAGCASSAIPSPVDHSCVPQVPRVSKALYVIPIIAAPLAIALPTIGQVIGRDEDGPLAFLGAQLILAVWVFTAITQLVLVYKAWAAINDGHSRTTPGRAVGFLFIPIYNIYWLINITRGFAIDYNQFAVRHDLRAPSLDPGFFTTRALLLLLLPLGAVDCVLSLVILLFNTVIGAVVTAQVCGAINAVARATTPDRPEASV